MRWAFSKAERPIDWSNDKAPHNTNCLFLIFRAVLKGQTSKIIEDSKASRPAVVEVPCVRHSLLIRSLPNHFVFIHMLFWVLYNNNGSSSSCTRALRSRVAHFHVQDDPFIGDLTGKQKAKQLPIYNQASERVIKQGFYRGLVYFIYVTRDTCFAWK